MSWNWVKYCVNQCGLCDSLFTVQAKIGLDDFFVLFYYFHEYFYLHGGGAAYIPFFKIFRSYLNMNLNALSTKKCLFLHARFSTFLEYKLHADFGFAEYISLAKNTVFIKGRQMQMDKGFGNMV